MVDGLEWQLTTIVVWIQRLERVDGTAQAPHPLAYLPNITVITSEHKRLYVLTIRSL